MKGRFLLDVVVRKCTSIFKLFTGENETLLIWWNTFLVLNFSLHVFDGIGGFNFKCNRFTGQGLDEDLHTAPKSKDEMKCRFLLDVIIGECTAIFELLSGENETLLIWWDTFFILDLGFDVFDGVRCLDFKSDSFSGQGLHEDLHTTTKSKDKMKSWFLLDVIIRKGSSVFKLFTGEDKTLLVWWNTFFVLNFSFDIFDGVRSFDFQSDSLSSECLDKDLHTTTKTEDEMKGRFLLDVIIRKGSSIFELLTGKDKTLLIWWNTFLVLNLGLDIFNGIRCFNLQGDCLSSQSLDENLHTTTETKDQMKSWFLLNVIVGQCSTIFELLAGKDQTLLVRWDSLLVLDLSLDILDGIRCFNL